eukprot:1362874-Amorphochlora_amoeboformis.AAC.2
MVLALDDFALLLVRIRGLVIDQNRKSALARSHCGHLSYIGCVTSVSACPVRSKSINSRHWSQRVFWEVNKHKSAPPEPGKVVVCAYLNLHRYLPGAQY